MENVWQISGYGCVRGGIDSDSGVAVFGSE